MKKLNLLLFFSFCFIAAWAQMEDDPKKTYSLKHEIGFNGTQLVANLFTNEQALENGNDFSLVYKYHAAEKGALRLGFTGRISNNTQTLNAFDTRENAETAGLLRLGYEFRKSVAPKWTTLFGIDAIVGYEKRTVTTDSNFDVVVSTSNTTRYGGSPFFGIEFKINEHIRISTELAFSFNNYDISTSDTFQSFPEFNSTLSSEETEFLLESPGFIFFSVRF